MSVAQIKFIKEVCYCVDVENYFDSAETKEYDKRGNILVSKSYYDNPKEIDSKSTYRYSEGGNLIEKTDSEFNTFERVTYIYENKKIKEIILCDSEGHLKKRTIRQYNEKENEETDCLYDANGLLIATTKRLYNNSGKMLESVYLFIPDNYESNLTIRYDENGREIESCTCCYRNAMIESKRLRKYDEKGNLIEETYSDFNKEEQQRSIYQYHVWDKHNNWTLKYTYETKITANSDEEEMSPIDDDDDVPLLYTEEDFATFLGKYEGNPPDYITKRKIEYF